MSDRTVIRRHQYADYLNVGTSDAPSYVLMGTGFTTLDEEPGANSESVKYVNEVSETSTVISYSTVFPFEAEQIVSQEAINALYEVGRNHYIGEDAEFEYVRVELWDAGDTANTYAARKFLVSAEIADITGENKMTISGNLNACGDPTDGTFNTSTLEFTEASA